MTNEQMAKALAAAYETLNTETIMAVLNEVANRTGGMISPTFQTVLSRASAIQRELRASN